MCFSQATQASISQLAVGDFAFAAGGLPGVFGATSNGGGNPLTNIANNTMSVIGDLNGSTAENAQAQKALDQATQTQDALVAAQQTTAQQNEVSASGEAAGLRKSANASATNSLGFNSGPNVNLLASVGTPSPAQDFMGR